MSLISAFYTGVSGLHAYGEGLQVIGDNIANVNTTGFKSSRMDFGDLLSQNIRVASGTRQMGLGVQVNNITTNFSEGGVQSSGQLTDMRVNGNGMFVLQDNAGLQHYSRNGNFNFDKTGILRAANGMTVQGYSYNRQTGAYASILGPIQAVDQAIDPQTTTEMNFRLNLNADTPITTTSFDPANPGDTSQYATSITVYDSVGGAHEVEVFFTHTSEGSWEWNMLSEGATAPNGSGTITFDSSGKMTSSTNAGTAAFTFRGQAQTINVNFDSTTSQYGAKSIAYSGTQDGFASGSLERLEIDQDGTIVGYYSNGRALPIAALALANFTNLQGLHKDGATIFSETPASGEPNIGTPGSGSLGTISSYALELSNVDLANEFVNMITTQRAYQANTRVVTTGDEMLAEVLNIKR